MKLRLLASALISILGCFWMAHPASALECPVPQKLPHPGVLKETQAQIDQTAKRLSSGDVCAQVKAIILDLRSRYPHVENAELVNYVISAYCPVVAGLPGLSGAEKKARMDGFVSQGFVTPVPAC
jgi:hypothetical protein